MTVLELRDVDVALPGGLRLAARIGEGPLRPFLLVHELAADARSWDPVAARLLAAGHGVVAVDLRGHGRSDVPPTGHDVDTCADDLALLIETLDLTGGRAPVVAGHGWGAGIVLSMAARRAGAAAVACVDGGWIRLSKRFATFAECWSRLGPAEPDADVADPDQLDVVRELVHSLYLGDPRAWYPLVGVPSLLLARVPAEDEPDPDGAGQVTRDGVAEALAGLPRARATWYEDADHDLPADQPARVAADLQSLAADADPDVDRAVAPGVPAPRPGT